MNTTYRPYLFVETYRKLKQDRDYERADELRDTLRGHGYILSDLPGGRVRLREPGSGENLHFNPDGSLGTAESIQELFAGVTGTGNN